MAKRTRTSTRQTRTALGLLGLQIRQGRIGRKWSTTDLAERAGVTRVTLRKVETGDPSVAIGIVFDMATLVGVPLFFEDDHRLLAEADRLRDLVRLMPRRVHNRDEDVDDDF